MTIHAHFDGKVIVPDDPVDLPQNQALILKIQTIEAEEVVAEGSALDWLAANATDSEAMPADLAEQHDGYLYRGSSNKRD